MISMETFKDSAVSTSLSSDNLIREGDSILFWFGEEEVSYLVEAARGKRVAIHCGKPLLMDDWIGREFGEKVVCDHGEGFLLKPTLEDFMMKASRQSGIIYPKDAAFLMMRTGIQSGSKVLEVGTGSGSLTMALAQTVAPSGKVYTFDRRTDLPQHAVRNIQRAHLEPYVVFNQRESAAPFPEGGFDAAVLDIPTPWEEVAAVKQALKGGSKLASLNPTFNQIERMAEALKEHGFVQVECVELLERQILARAGKTRPVQRMVSHTEFLLFGTKTL